MAQYKTGTVSVTNGSATVTGSGTLWSGEIAAGDLFTIVGDNAWYEVASVGSNTSITLSANYAGTTGSGKSYAISRDFTTRLALPYPQKGDIETASIIKRAFEQIDTETNIATANYSATSAPTANDDSGDGYSIGSWWVNVTSDEAYLCVDATVGAAVWTKISVDVPSEIVALLAGQSVSMASLTLSGGTANGVLYLNGSKVATSGSALTFDGTNLGLGTASPISSGGYSTLTINGSTGSQIAFKSGDVAKQYIYTTATDITYRNDNGAQIWYGSGELMRLTSTGLGVGTSSPLGKLDARSSNGVIGTMNTSTAAVNNTAQITLAPASAFTGAWATGPAVKGLLENTSSFATAITINPYSGSVGQFEAARFDSSGRFMVGTTSTTAKFVAIGASGNTYIAIDNASSGENYFAANSVNIFQTAGVERARIDSSGNLLVGTTGNTRGGVGAYFASTDVFNAYIGVGAGSISSLFTGWYGATSTTTGTLSFNVTSNGNVTNTNNSYGAISDAKLKENIVDASPKLADIMQVRVRNYNFKEGQTHKQIGVVAQELEQVFPAMIDEVPDRDSQGNDLGTTTKQVKYSVFVPMLIKAIQELKAEFDAYKASHP